MRFYLIALLIFLSVAFSTIPASAAVDITVLTEAGTDLLQEADTDQTSVVLKEIGDYALISPRLPLTQPRIQIP